MFQFWPVRRARAAADQRRLRNIAGLLPLLWLTGVALAADRPPVVEMVPANRLGYSPLIQAAIDGDVDRVEELFPQSAPRSHAATLLQAIYAGQFHVVQRLLDLGVRDYPAEIGKEHALHAAASHRKIDIIDLLCRYGADPNWLDNRGRSTLQQSLHQTTSDPTDTRAAWKLIECGALPVGARSESPSGPEGPERPLVPVLHDAVTTGDVALVKRLIELGADVHARGGSRNRTALFQPLYYVPFIPYGQPLGSDMARLLLKHGADAAARDDSGRTALGHVTCSPGPEIAEVIRILLEAGAPVDDPSPKDDGIDALGCAAMFALPGAVRVLLEHGADPNRLASDGRTPLGLLFEPARYYDALNFLRALHPSREQREQASIEVIELLVAYGARVDLDPVVVRESQRSSGPDQWFRAGMQASYRAQTRACIEAMPKNMIGGAPQVPTPSQEGAEPEVPVQPIILDHTDGAASDLTLSPDGRWLVFGVPRQNHDNETELVLYDLYSNRRYPPFSIEGRFSARTVTWREDSLGFRFSDRYLAISLEGLQPGTEAGFVAAWKEGMDRCADRDREGRLTGKPGRWTSVHRRIWSPVEPFQYDLFPGTASHDLLVAVRGDYREPLVKHERRRADRRMGAFVKDFNKWEALFAELEAEILAKSGEGEELERFRRERDRITQEMNMVVRAPWEQQLGDQRLSPDGRYLYYEVISDPPEGVGGTSTVQVHYVADVLSRPVKVWTIEPPVSAAYWHPNGRQLVVRAWESWQLDDPDDPQARLGVVTFP